MVRRGPGHEDAGVRPGWAKLRVGSERRKYSEEFKREAVNLTRQPGSTVSQVARDIGVGSNLLFRWRRELEGEGKPFPGSGVA